MQFKIYDELFINLCNDKIRNLNIGLILWMQRAHKDKNNRIDEITLLNENLFQHSESFDEEKERINAMVASRTIMWIGSTLR